MKYGESFFSPIFKTESLQKTIWMLCIMRGENDIEIHLCRLDNEGPEKVTVNIHVFIEMDGSVVANYKNNAIFCKLKTINYSYFEEQNDIVSKSTFMPNSSVTAHCKLWQNDAVGADTSQIFASTIISIHQRFFVWVIENLNSIGQDFRNTLLVKENFEVAEELVTFDLVLTVEQDYVKVFSLTTHKVKYPALLKWHLFDTKGNKVDIVQNKDNLLNSDGPLVIIPKDFCPEGGVLSLHCECTFSTGIQFSGIVKTISEIYSPQANTVDVKPFSYINAQKKTD
ncbi:hypothetical protein NPIL_674461 [Nephila pilipes]|uniref:Uncharacterized protein n=1 Tax=Nephila pilipes TaxID=299642 RepID=A0A8X6N4I6_NEPPI|nr:hypothetical protein NPIL_674461 [Nephila pilipes]